MASIAACHWYDSAEQLEMEAAVVTDEAMQGLDQQTNIVESGLGVFLAVCAALTLLISNFQKVKLITIYITAQPYIHQIMPNTVRNAQLSWLSNFKMLATVLESTSLSDYMVDLGGPVVPGKAKYFSQEQKNDIAENL